MPFRRTNQNCLAGCFRNLSACIIWSTAGRSSVIARIAAGFCEKSVTAAAGLKPVRAPACSKGRIFTVRTAKKDSRPWMTPWNWPPEGSSTDLQQLALEYLAEMPFERASELFDKTTGISFSDHRLHSLFAAFTDQMTIEDVIPAAEEIVRRLDNLPTSGNRRPILAVASDGAHMPTRPPGAKGEKRGPGEYREAKGFRIYAIGSDDIVQIASWHQIQNAEEFARDLNIAASRIPQDKVRICLLGDGASWVWRCMEEVFSGSLQILDYYHCMEQLHALAEAQYGDDPDRALSWVIGAIGHIYYNETCRVIGGLKRMKPKDNNVKEQIRKLIGYLENNQHRTQYDGAKKGGYPIGSGGIESANKFICHIRLKRSGAWWLKSNGNGMLRLRCSLVNGTFNEAFARYVTRDQAKRYLRTNA